MQPNIHNEFGRLKSVVVGIASTMGAVPKLEDCYDARSFESVELGAHPTAADCAPQEDGFAALLEGLGIQVFRPLPLDATNQVFARDIGFVLFDQFIVPNIIEDRAAEYGAIEHVVDTIDSANIVQMPEGAFAEGGDVMLAGNTVYVGVSTDDDFETYKTARTNRAGFEFLASLFPERNFVAVELVKSDTNPRGTALHLDCAMHPLDQCLLVYPPAFASKEALAAIEAKYDAENVFVCTDEEGYELTTNIFCVGPREIVIAERFMRLKPWLEARGFKVHTVPYHQIVKMGGLLRCSTMPLERE